MAKVFHAGALREQVEIEQPSPSRNAVGEQQLRYDRVAIRRAQVIATGGSEKTTLASVQAITNYEVLIRYFDGLTTRHRMKWNGHTLNIENIVDPDSKKEWMLLSCTEKV